jgi:hypothetical protein
MTSTDLTKLSADRSKPLAVTGRLKRAIELMVWEGLTRDDAAVKAGLRPHSLYVAFRKPHVKSYYLAEVEVLRLSGRAKRLHRLDALAMQDENKNAAVAAIKVADAIPDELPQRFGTGAQTPGVTIRIIQVAAPVSAPMVDVTAGRPAIANPIASDRSPILSHQKTRDEMGE